MKTRPARFGDKDGYQATGEIMLCDMCNNDTFHVCVITISGENHNHLEYTRCHTSYCDGACGHRTLEVRKIPENYS